MFIRLLLFLTFCSVPALAGVSKAIGLSDCDQSLTNASPKGEIPGFNLTIHPRFSREDLEQNRASLTPKNSKYILGETGNSLWVVEDRLIKGAKQSEIVAVKYMKHYRPDDDSDLTHLMEVTNNFHVTFERLGLLKYFDVLVPLEIGPGYAVFPLVFGQALSNLTLETLRHLNPPAQYSNPNVVTLGPPTEAQAPELALIWEKQQIGARAVLEALKAAGAKIEGRTIEKSWSGVKYLSYAWTQIPGHPPISIRPDVIVTTDGRFVIVDAE